MTDLNTRRAMFKTEQSLNMGKLPPQAIDMEEAVLGALMLDGESYDVVKSFLEPQHFYKPCNSLIYNAIIEVYKKGNPIDILSVTLQLKSSKELESVGGPYEITILTNRIGSATNIEYHARIVYSMFLRREVIRISQLNMNDAYDDGCDVVDLINTNVKQFRDIENKIIDEGESIGIDKIIEQTYALMAKAKANDGILGHKIMIETVDDMLCGLQPGNVTVIAARPGMGKSALVKTVFVNLAKQKIKVKLFSLEVKATKFMMNIMSDILETNNKNVFTGNLNSEQRTKLTEKLEEIKSYMDLDDKSGITIQYFEKKAKQAVKDGCQVLMIDYIQLMNVLAADADSRNTNQVVSFLTKNIKRIAADLNVPIIELSQLSREVEKRADKRPILADLRDSGSIEQDAENVLFIHRPEYYGTLTDKKGNDLRGLAEIIIAKNRNGKLGRAVVKFTPQYTKFEDLYTTEPTPNLLGEEESKVITTGEDPEF